MRDWPARPPPQHPSHEISVTPGSSLERALGTRARVNSYHHQSISDLGDGVTVSATAPDGVIEAIEVPGAAALCIGVQWELQEQPDSPLFALFVDAVREHAAARELARSRRPRRRRQRLTCPATLSPPQRAEQPSSARYASPVARRPRGLRAPAPARLPRALRRFTIGAGRVDSSERITITSMPPGANRSREYATRSSRPA